MFKLDKNDKKGLILLFIVLFISLFVVVFEGIVGEIDLIISGSLITIMCAIVIIIILKISYVSTNSFINDSLNEFKEQLALRDWLIATDFKGKITNKKLIKELKEYEEVGNYGLRIDNSFVYPFKYKRVKEEIMVYYFENIEKMAKKIREFENKQEILNKYSDKIKIKKGKNINEKK